MLVYSDMNELAMENESASNYPKSTTAVCSFLFRFSYYLYFPPK